MKLMKWASVFVFVLVAVGAMWFARAVSLRDWVYEYTTLKRAVGNPAGDFAGVYELTQSQGEATYRPFYAKKLKVSRTIAGMSLTILDPPDSESPIHLEREQNLWWIDRETAEFQLDRNRAGAQIVPGLENVHIEGVIKCAGEDLVVSSVFWDRGAAFGLIPFAEEYSTIMRFKRINPTEDLSDP